MTHPDPFAVLGIAPTRDPATVKRAYFSALALNPPHRDAEAFRRVRAAFEVLSRPGGLGAAYVASPLDLQAELTAYRARFDAALAAAGEARRSQEESAAAMARTIDVLSKMSWSEALHLSSIEAVPASITDEVHADVHPSANPLLRAPRSDRA